MFPQDITVQANDRFVPLVTSGYGGNLPCERLPNSANSHCSRGANELLRWVVRFPPDQATCGFSRRGNAPAPSASGLRHLALPYNQA